MSPMNNYKLQKTVNKTFSIQTQNGFIIIDNKITVSMDCSNSLHFCKILNPVPLHKTINYKINTNPCNNIVEITKTLNCFVKYIKYETVYNCDIKWLMPTHIIFQKNNTELDIMNIYYLDRVTDDELNVFDEYNDILYKKIYVTEKIYNNINNVIDSEPIVN